MSEEVVSDEHTIAQFGSNLDPSLARFFVDFDSEIDKLRLAFEGKDIDYQYDPPKEINIGEPLMNKLGIGKFVTFLKSVSHKGIPLSNFHKDFPYHFSELTGYLVSRDIFVSFNEYNIRSTDDGNRIIFPTILTYFAHLCRAVGESDKKFFKGFTRESHIITPPKNTGWRRLT